MSLENMELTPEQITEMGKVWCSLYLSKLSVAERLAGLSTEERLIGLKPEERLIGLKPEDVLSRFKLEEIETYLQQRRNHSASPKH